MQLSIGESMSLGGLTRGKRLCCKPVAKVVGQGDSLERTSLLRAIARPLDTRPGAVVIEARSQKERFFDERQVSLCSVWACTQGRTGLPARPEAFACAKMAGRSERASEGKRRQQIL